MAIASLSACRHHHHHSTTPPPTQPPPTPATYSVGGNVTGLTGSVVLRDNGGDDLTVNASGVFKFATALTTGAAYNVTVQTQPANQTCTAASSSGTIGSSNVTNVAIACTTNTPPPQSAGIVQQLVPQGESPAISRDGRYMTYQTPAAGHVELMDTCLGAPAGCTVTTVEISPTGNLFRRTVRNLSGDGRFIVFDAVQGATHEVYLRDTCNGQPVSCTPATQLVSINGGTPADRDAYYASIGSDGRFVIFESQADNLGSANPLNQTRVYSYDSCLGSTDPCTASVRLVTVSAGGQAYGGNEPSADETGRFVAFSSGGATSEVTGHAADIYLRDTCVGVASGCTPSTILISAPRSGASPDNGYAANASVSNGGRFVLFEATLADLVTASNNGLLQVYMRDTCIGASGACTPSTQMISVDSAGNAGTIEGSLTQAHALFSASGRYVGFSSRAHNLSPLVANGPPGYEAYVRDTCFGASGACTPATHLISVDSTGNLITTGSAEFKTAALTGDGRYAILYGGITGSELHLALTGF